MNVAAVLKTKDAAEAAGRPAVSAGISSRRKLLRRHMRFLTLGEGKLPDLAHLPFGTWTAGGRLRTGTRLAAFILFTLVLMPPQMLALALSRRAAVEIPHFYHRIVCRLLGVRIVQRGRRVAGQNALYIVNHSSWLDIPVLSAAIPTSFIAKAEIASWPGFGLLAKLQRTIFVSREKRTRTGDARDEIASRLRAGDNLVLFPEGTSSDGNRVLPFKSALFGAAEVDLGRGDGATVMVQPVSIAYTRVRGLPLGRDGRPFLTWFGDMELVPHLTKALSLGTLTVEVEFHEPLTVTQAGGRKALAQHCERAVRSGYARAIRGA